MREMAWERKGMKEGGIRGEEQGTHLRGMAPVTYLLQLGSTTYLPIVMNLSMD